MFGSAGAGLLEKLLHPAGAASIGDLAYFVLIYDFLHSEIERFGLNMSRSVTVTAGGIALVLLTIWVFFQGLRFVTGQNRESFMAFLMNAMRALLIVSAAMTFATTNSSIYNFLTEDLQGAITAAVTGEDGDDPKSRIDKNLAYMQLGLSSIDVLQISDDPNLYQEKSRDMWLVGVGTAGPAMVGGAMLLMYEVAWALFIGLGPIFILCLLFDVTKSLFQKWLLYGIGTMFSMAVLAAMIAIATKTVLAVAEAFWASSLIGSILGTNFNDGMNSMALQQGGIGLLLTVLIISTPPMVANFFQGTLGGFSAYSQISGDQGGNRGWGGRGGGNRGGSYGGSFNPERTTDSRGYESTSRTPNSSGTSGPPQIGATTRVSNPSGGGVQSPASTGQRGLAGNSNASRSVPRANPDTGEA
ncbi:MAG: type IV secretion system protein [Lysobacteraceae bacterium]